MNVSIGDRWETFIEAAVKEGRYSSASEVVREGLRLVEEREARLNALRDHIQAAVAEPQRHSIDEVAAAIEAELDDWESSRRTAS